MMKIIKLGYILYQVDLFPDETKFKKRKRSRIRKIMNQVPLIYDRKKIIDEMGKKDH